jgi:hypothetical protein
VGGPVQEGDRDQRGRKCLGMTSLPVAERICDLLVQQQGQGDEWRRERRRVHQAVAKDR